jgi:2,4-dienoyl-CoA reductase-like NADH-dependent reductase (Old Yellow Enzyme family)
LAADVSALFTPLRVRSLTIPNRFAMSPMNRNASPNGVSGDDMAQFYLRRVEGEFGLIFTGGIAIDHPGASGVYVDRPCQVPLLQTPEAQAGWRHVVDTVHGGGGKIIAQLWHLGVMRLPGTGYYPDAPSARPSGIYGPTTENSFVDPATAARLAVPGPELTDAEILELIDAYARSAGHAIDVGFDGVEIHGAQGYLPDAFMWEATNKRTDRWGGNRGERARFAAEVVRAMRRTIGDRSPIFYRFSQWKHQDVDATIAPTPADLEQILIPLAAAGVDVFDAGHFYIERPMYPGSPLNLAGWAKKLTGLPSMAIGAVGLSKGQHDPSMHGPPEAIDNLAPVIASIERGDYDLVGVARTSLNDPAFPRKIRLGEPLVPWNEGRPRHGVGA